MNTLAIKKGRLSNRRLAYSKSFLSIFLCIFIISVSISTCYLSVPVFAMDGWQYLLTVWELITTLTVGAGAAPVSSAVNQAGMASELGQMTVAELASGEVSVAQCDAAIQALTSSSNAASQAAGGIAQSFASTAADAAQAAEAIASSGVEGVEAAEGAMSAGENLANCAAASVGAGSIVGMLGMEFTGAAALGAGAVAVVAGVGLGVLAHNVVNYFKDALQKGLKINTPETVRQKCDPTLGYAYGIGMDGTFSNNYVGEKPKIGVTNGIWNAQCGILHCNDGDAAIYSGEDRCVVNYRYRTSDGALYSSSGVGTNITKLQSGTCGGYPQYYYNGSIDDISYNNVTQFFNGSRGTVENNIESPDLVNPNGNFTYNPQTNNYNYNYENNPTYNTTNNTLQPIYNTDYEQFINTTNNNTVNNIDNSQTFKNFLENHLTEVTTPPPDVEPDIPVQPDNPTLPDLTPEQVEQNKELMLPTTLKEYFPFCIPFDIYALFTKFNDIEREAPHVEFELDLQRAGKYEINIDFSDYDDLAALLRSLELIGFIMLLMVAARKLIGD